LIRLLGELVVMCRGRGCERPFAAEISAKRDDTRKHEPRQHQQQTPWVSHISLKYR
jgi:hypothetical protein